MKKTVYLIICYVLLLSSCKERNKTISTEHINSIENNESINKTETVKKEIINDLDSQEKIRKENISKEFIQRWSIPNTKSELKIKENGTYSYGHPMWDGPFAFGKCSMQDGKLLVEYPDSLDINETNDTYKKHDLEVLFKNNESILLEYDSEYEDFYTIGCLRTDELIITTFYGEDSPANKIYMRNGIKVKKLPNYSFIISSDNMKLREKPSINSKIMTFTHGWEYRNFPYDLIPDSKNVVWLKKKQIFC